MDKDKVKLIPKLAREHVSRAELHGIVNILTEALQAVQERLTGLEMHGVRFAGTHQRSQAYRKGSVVSHGGSMFTALRNVAEGEVPGQVVDAWQLSMKAGETGVLRGIDFALKTKIKAAQAAAVEATAAAARAAETSAETARQAAQRKRMIEVVKVVKHDASGRIVEFQKELVERDAEQ